MCQIRAEKFDLVLPGAMHDNDLDMWIVVMREGLLDPMWEALGRGYVGDWAYYVFTDRGERAERAALGVGGYMLEQCGVYDHFGSAASLAEYVAERNPARIGVNMAASIGGADGLSHTSYLHLREVLGAPYADRLVSAERFVSDFRATRTAIEIAAFAEAGEMSREIAERAFSNEVITPGVTTLEDTAWWMWDQLLARGLDSSFDMPSVYITGPTGIEASSSDRIIQRGDLLMIDWGVGFLDFYTDMKRVAYVLRDGETEPPAGIRHAFERAMQVRDIMKASIKPAPTAQEAVDATWAAIQAAGFNRIDFNQPTNDPRRHRCGDRSPLGRQLGPRFRPVAGLLQPDPAHLRTATRHTDLRRAVRLYGQPGLGRRQGAHPARGRRGGHRAGRGVALPGDAPDPGDQVGANGHPSAHRRGGTTFTSRPFWSNPRIGIRAMSSPMKITGPS